MHSDSTVEADTNTDILPGLPKQPNLTLELFPNHSENLESVKKVKNIFLLLYVSCNLAVLIILAYFGRTCVLVESSGEDKAFINWKVFPPTGS